MMKDHPPLSYGVISSLLDRKEFMEEGSFTPSSNHKVIYNKGCDGSIRRSQSNKELWEGMWWIVGMRSIIEWSIKEGSIIPSLMVPGPNLEGKDWSERTRPPYIMETIKWFYGNGFITGGVTIEWGFHLLILFRSLSSRNGQWTFLLTYPP